MKKIRQQFADTIYKIGNKDKNIVVMVGILVMVLCSHLQKKIKKDILI